MRFTSIISIFNVFTAKTTIVPIENFQVVQKFLNNLKNIFFDWKITFRWLMLPKYEFEKNQLKLVKLMFSKIHIRVVI